MFMEQEEEHLSKLKEKAGNALPKGWNDPLRITKLYKESIKLILEMEEIQRTMNNLVEKAEIVVQAKETLTWGTKKKTRGDLVVENQKLYN